MNSPQMFPLQSFTCFPELPVELRLKVWRICQPGPRLVIFGRYTRYSIHDSNEEHGPPAPIALFINRESRHETLKTYCLAHPPLHRFVAFSPDLDILLLWSNIWPEIQYGFFVLSPKPYAGPQFKARSLALSFASIEADFQELLQRMLTYPLLEEFVLWQERNWEDSIPITPIDAGTAFDAWFKLRGEANRLRDFVQLLDNKAFRFPSGRRPDLKFMRVKEDLLGKGEDSLARFCRPV